MVERYSFARLVRLVRFESAWSAWSLQNVVGCTQLIRSTFDFLNLTLFTNIYSYREQDTWYVATATAQYVVPIINSMYRVHYTAWYIEEYANCCRCCCRLLLTMRGCGAHSLPAKGRRMFSQGERKNRMSQHSHHTQTRGRQRYHHQGKRFGSKG